VLVDVMWTRFGSITTSAQRSQKGAKLMKMRAPTTKGLAAWLGFARPPIKVTSGKVWHTLALSGTKSEIRGCLAPSESSRVTLLVRVIDQMPGTAQKPTRPHLGRVRTLWY
jgi:hypothetical protein